MPKNTYYKIALITAAALVLFALLLAGHVWASSRNRSFIKVYLEDGKTESVEFESLAMLPGDSLEYKIKLKSNGVKRCDLLMRFVETEEKDLKKFAYVKILAEDRLICDERMDTVFEGKEMVLPVDFDEGENTELTVIYYLPLEVGNEAKNAEAIFELQMTAKNK